MTRIGDILGISSTERTHLEISSWESGKERFNQELNIFCCWLGGHAIIRKDVACKWRLCRCGLKRVSDETLWLRYNPPGPDMDRLMARINTHVFVDATSEDKIRRALGFPIEF